MGAGAAVLAAAERPGDVLGLLLLGPFVRNPPGGALAAVLFRLAMLRPWGRRASCATTPGGRRDSARRGTPSTRDAVAENLERPGHWKAFVATTRTSHAAAEARTGDVTPPPWS